MAGLMERSISAHRCARSAAKPFSFAVATLTEVPMSSDKSKREQDRELSEALEETFPASDAVAVNEADDRPVRPVHRKPALIDKHLVEELAEEVARKSREPPVSSEE